MSVERCTASMVAVNYLLDIGFIREVHFQSLLANVVLVKKSMENGGYVCRS